MSHIRSAEELPFDELSSNSRLQLTKLILELVPQPSRNCGFDDPLVPNDHRPTPLGEGQVGVLLADFLEYGPQVVSFEQLNQGPTTLGR